MDRSRRTKSSSTRDRLAAYKLARETGKRSDWEAGPHYARNDLGADSGTAQSKVDTDIYEEVSEEQYNAIVKGRLQRDDFVQDDGVGGYQDNGMDDFGESGGFEDSDEDDRAKVKSASSAASSSKKPAKPKPAAPPPAKMSAYRPVVAPQKEDEFMADLLGEMDKAATAPVPARPRPRKRKSSPEPVDFRTLRDNSGFPSSDGISDDYGASDDVPFSPAKRAKTANGSRSAYNTDRSSPVPAVQDLEIEAADFDWTDEELMAIDDPAPVKTEEMDIDLKPKPVANGISKAKKEDDGPPAWLKLHATLAVADPEALTGPLGSKSSIGEQSAKCLESDGSFRFFWLDAYEADGKVHFIGKCRDKDTKAWISCCVTVENMERNLYVLKRQKQLDDDENETDIIPTDEDVWADVAAIRRQAGISSWKAKWVERQYAFGEKDIPTGKHPWLEVVYSFNHPALPSNIMTPNIARILGTNTSAFELLVMKRRIMGPCWLNIKQPTKTEKPISWTRFEVIVSNPEDINPFPDSDDKAPRELPPLNIMSLTLRTIVNHETNQREIVVAATRIWPNYAIEDEKLPESTPHTKHTFVRPLEENKWPPQFKDVARQKGITTCANEFELLSHLLVLTQKADPDVIVGHDFVGVDLDVLLHRLRAHKSRNWSRVSRFRRQQWPHIGKQGTNLKFLSGRLVCDLSSDGAKGMISSTTWSMTEICKTHLGQEREDIDPNDTGARFDHTVSAPKILVEFVQHCEVDAFFQMAIADKVQILPLTLQLTNLAGNAWNKTLNGGRAERNEYILLHEFYKLGYICPDKTYGKKSALAVKAEAEEGDDAAAVTSKGKRDKYKGGLVLQPKRGLWDKYILVMDFNSLYPSIIQEYNIDYTTIDISQFLDTDELPEKPDADKAEGVMPRVIKELVQRRQQVKKLMKAPNLPEARRKQYDIRQQALKLTANSMYGCLGFEYSRFYARPLAALTTFMGREALRRTCEVAEGMGIDVVYGDTDSVFLNSNKLTIKEAKEIANEFKKLVNEQYKRLEIDLDGIFERLLLLQKKKYAALKVDGTDENKTTTKEVKGLDMKRREYCALSKDMSQKILDVILDPKMSSDVVVEKIHEGLIALRENVTSGNIPLEQFIINKRLGKEPEAYPDGKSQPHVQVALRMKLRNATARAGDVIPYVFCKSDADKASQADKAHHPDEVRKSGGKLQIDYDFYLANQILPPAERLCDPIEGTDRARLAECLGLDPRRYQVTVVGETEERAFGSLESQVPDTERFKECEPFVVRCRGCTNSFAFSSLGQTDSAEGDQKNAGITPAGCLCPGCKKPLGTASVQVQLEMQIRRHVSRFYEGWTVCQEATCRHRTRMMSVYGRRCLKPGCTGKVALEYQDAAIYTQLAYLRSLFDGDKAISKAKAARQDELRALVGLNRGLLEDLLSSVDRYMDMCGRRWVDMKEMFSFMKLS
ncbi:hypothetical protein AURDEDRAFT_88520 [Auricularia subglabra TFB-10046 SS5]|nr:hypothetical protein AURDEDRAFT_88520 [Auricularia subglabra TFB-10046 SS5]